MSSYNKNKKLLGLSKDEKYKKEQSIIKTKLDNILNLNDTNCKFYLCDINDDKQKEIENMYSDIRKYYTCGKSRMARSEVQRLYLAIIKIVYKQAQIDLIRSQKTVERDGKKINTGMYIVNNA